MDLSHLSNCWSLSITNVRNVPHNHNLDAMVVEAIKQEFGYGSICLIEQSKMGHAGRTRNPMVYLTLNDVLVGFDVTFYHHNMNTHTILKTLNFLIRLTSEFSTPVGWVFSRIYQKNGCNIHVDVAPPSSVLNMSVSKIDKIIRNHGSI